MLKSKAYDDAKKKSDLIGIYGDVFDFQVFNGFGSLWMPYPSILKHSTSVSNLVTICRGVARPFANIKDGF